MGICTSIYHHLPRKCLMLRAPCFTADHGPPWDESLAQRSSQRYHACRGMSNAEVFCVVSSCFFACQAMSSQISIDNGFLRYWAHLGASKVAGRSIAGHQARPIGSCIFLQQAEQIPKLSRAVCRPGVCHLLPSTTLEYTYWNYQIIIMMYLLYSSLASLLCCLISAHESKWWMRVG